MPLVDETDLLRDIGESLGRRPLAAGTRAADATGLPPPERDLLPLRDVLTARRSVREFGDEPVAGGDVAFLVRHATTATRHVWPGVSRTDLGLTVLAVALDVADIAPGTYAPGDGMERLGDVARPASLRETYAPAPVLFAVCGDLTWACSPEGSGYGGLLASAGALGYGLWLSALSIGLAASAFGGPCDDLTEAARLAHPDTRHLFTVAVGRPKASRGPV